MNITDLQRRIKLPYFDYQKLKSALGDDSHERRTISLLIKKGLITRVKKGLYTWGESLSIPYSKEVLANLIYGPSYVSLEYALSYHGLIPERVEMITSVTTKRKKEFSTPVGFFSYEHLYPEAFPWGQTLVVVQNNITALMATPEKALLDLISLRIKEDVSASRFEDLLIDDLRIDEEEFSKLDRDKILELAMFYRSISVKNLSQFIKKRS